MPAFFCWRGDAVSFRSEVMGVDGGWFCWRGDAVSFRCVLQMERSRGAHRWGNVDEKFSGRIAEGVWG